MPLSPGDRIPFWTAVGLDRSFHSADSQAGRAAVLIVAGADFRTPLANLLPAFAARAACFATTECDLAVMLPFAAIPALHAQGHAATAGLPVRLFRDDVLGACYLRPGTALVLVHDRSGRLVTVRSTGTAAPAALVDEALAAACASLMHRPPAAPTLSIPGLLAPELCREVIAGFEAAATFESLVSGVGADGRPADRVDHSRKRRRDWLLGPDEPLHAPVVAALERRCLPELNRAFQHGAAHLDRILVVRYDAGAGHFRRHRDNTGPAVTFRQFALSVNLNTGAYEGGDLRFPEYCNTPRRPACGEGIVFSASLLHEVTDVTQGRRYALLTFLHDAAGEARRRPAVQDAA